MRNALAILGGVLLVGACLARLGFVKIGATFVGLMLVFALLLGFAAVLAHVYQD